MGQRRAGAIFLSLCIFAQPGKAQRNADAAPILDVRDISQRCCSGQFDRTYLRVFGDGRVEWEAFDEQETSLPGTLSEAAQRKEIQSVEAPSERLSHSKRSRRTGEQKPRRASPSGRH